MSSLRAGRLTRWRRAEPSGPAVYTADTSDFGDEAEVSGRLVLIEGRCYGIENADGVQHAVVFPDGTTAVDGGIRTPSGTSILLGEAVAGSGGYYGQSELLDASGMPEECVKDEAAVMGTFAAQ